MTQSGSGERKKKPQTSASRQRCWYLVTVLFPSFLLPFFSLLSLFHPFPPFKNPNKPVLHIRTSGFYKNLESLSNIPSPLTFVSHLSICVVVWVCGGIVGAGVSELKIKVSTAAALSSIQDSSNQVFDRWWKEAVDWEGKGLVYLHKFVYFMENKGCR